MDKQHMIIVVLSVIALILAVVLVFKKSEGYYPTQNFITTLTPEQMQQAAANPTCQASLQNFCGVANSSQRYLGNTKAFEDATLAVSNACGPQFPPYSACQMNLNLPVGGVYPAVGI